ncbi:hypothetical protein B0H14DRAFT_3573478 [Mycena olivaceomarginata]|nr:hypothetical protein B0H14DRAFT_3573478 [Mycena olivaceomarginata]
MNWRDIRETIHGRPNSGRKYAEDSEGTPLTPHDPASANDGLDWLNDPLPDLRGSSTSRFDLAAEFDIEKYLHVLADSITAPKETPVDARHHGPTMADEWGSWA